jgi:hypothetical protein
VLLLKEKKDKLGCEIFNFYSLLSWYCQKLIPSVKLIILSNYAVLDDKVNIFLKKVLIFLVYFSIKFIYEYEYPLVIVRTN